MVQIRSSTRLELKPHQRVVVGKPLQSKLIEAISYTNKDLQMPPKGQLSKDEVEAFTYWIKIGAPDPRPSGPDRAIIASILPVAALALMWTAPRVNCQLKHATALRRNAVAAPEPGDPGGTTVEQCIKNVRFCNIIANAH